MNPYTPPPAIVVPAPYLVAAATSVLPAPTIEQAVSTARLTAMLARDRGGRQVFKGLHLGERQRVNLYRSRGGKRRK